MEQCERKGSGRAEARNVEPPDEKANDSGAGVVHVCKPGFSPWRRLFYRSLLFNIVSQSKPGDWSPQQPRRVPALPRVLCA